MILSFKQIIKYYLIGNVCVSIHVCFQTVCGDERNRCRSLAFCVMLEYLHTSIRKGAPGEKNNLFTFTSIGSEGSTSGLQLLHVIQTLVVAILGYQLVVLTALHYLTFVEHVYLVCVLDS